MSFQQSGLKENIHLSEETTELIESLALLLRVPLTSSQLSICVGLLQKGVSHRSLVDAITRYSGKVRAIYLFLLKLYRIISLWFLRY
ncbi:Mitotic-spindle organizing gamma-tubulin ring associated family protein [Acanthocheilonema viteae]